MNEELGASASPTALSSLRDQAPQAGLAPDGLQSTGAREKELAVLIVELLSIIRFGNPGFAGDLHIQRARRIIDGHPEAVAAGEANYRAYCAADPDHAPEGTAEELATCAHMLEEYGPECFPANEQGKVHFARAMMDATAAQIRAFLASGIEGEAGDPKGLHPEGESPARSEAEGDAQSPQPPESTQHNPTGPTP